MRKPAFFALMVGAWTASACSRPTEQAPSDAVPSTPATLAPARPATAQSIVASLAPDFRKCRNDHLSEVPDMAGTVELLLSFDDAGNVADASATPTGTVSHEVASCVAGRVRTERFPLPAGSRSLKLTIPIADDEDDENTAERAGARKVTEAMTGDFRKCYADVLESNPEAAGRLVVELVLTSSGEPEGVRVVSRTGNLPPHVDECILRRIEGAKFAPPRDRQIVIRVPVVLKRDNPS